MNFNLHDPSSDPICRFLNAGIAGTYVRPHRHRIDRWELTAVIQGQCELLTLTSDGVVKGRIILSSRDVTVAEFRAVNGIASSFAHPPRLSWK